MSDVLTFFGVMMALVTTGLVGFGGVTAIMAYQRRSRRELAPGFDPEEIELIRAQVAENEQLRARVGELEERLDFAERLLGQVSEGRSVGPGPG